MYRLSEHARKQASVKFTPEAVLLAADDPHITYPSLNHPGQARHIRGRIVAVVDPDREVVVTCYENVIRTPLRADQRVA